MNLLMIILITMFSVRPVSKEERVGMYGKTFRLDLVTESMLPKGVLEGHYKF